MCFSHFVVVHIIGVFYLFDAQQRKFVFQKLDSVFKLIEHTGALISIGTLPRILEVLTIIRIALQICEKTSQSCALYIIGVLF
jgi:hypothetical protein